MNTLNNIFTTGRCCTCDRTIQTSHVIFIAAFIRKLGDRRSMVTKYQKDLQFTLNQSTLLLFNCSHFSSPFVCGPHLQELPLAGSYGQHARLLAGLRRQRHHPLVQSVHVQPVAGGVHGRERGAGTVTEEQRQVQQALLWRREVRHRQRGRDTLWGGGRGELYCEMGRYAGGLTGDRYFLWDREAGRT